VINWLLTMGGVNAAEIVQEHRRRKQGYSGNYTLENFNG